MNTYVVPIRRFFLDMNYLKLKQNVKKMLKKLQNISLLHLDLEIMILMILEKLKRKNNYGEE